MFFLHDVQNLTLMNTISIKAYNNKHQQIWEGQTEKPYADFTTSQKF